MLLATIANAAPPEYTVAITATTVISTAAAIVSIFAHDTGFSSASIQAPRCIHI